MKDIKMYFSKKINEALVISVLSFVLFVSVLVSECGERHETQEIKRSVVKGVSVSEVKISEIERTYETAGTVKPETLSNISSRLMGVITSVRVKEGDEVKPGQLLATIDDTEIRQRVSAAEMALESASGNRNLAESTYKRYAGMYSEKAITAQEMDQVENQKKTADSEYFRAKAMHMEARTFLGYSRITSPIAGHVTRKNVDEGSMASPGMPLMVIESNGSFIETSVDESLAGRINKNTPVEVEIAGQVFKGHIEQIVPSVDPATRTFSIKIIPDNARMMSGQFVTVRLMLGKRQAVTVPQSAIINKGALTGVYTVNPEGVISYRIVKTGVQTPSGTEIISGLTSGEQIIVKGAGLAVDGAVIDRETAK